MAVFKNQYRYFSAMDSRVIRNSLLSVPAMGMLTAFLDRSETWQFRFNEIARSLKLTPDEARTILSELVEKGFAVERRDHFGVYYDVYAYPKDASGAPQSRDGQCPSAETAEREDGILPHDTDASRGTDGGTTERPNGMTDEQRAAYMEQIRKLFPPTKNYKSPYRD